jgi:hypothetical protein
MFQMILFLVQKRHNGNFGKFKCISVREKWSRQWYFHEALYVVVFRIIIKGDSFERGMFV